MNDAYLIGDSGSKLFTVFTPTFNRAGTLHRLYKSLEKQTFKNFEWIIIDDGSTDGTENIVKAWLEEAAFTIRYQWKKNEGKHIAYNIAAKMANGKLFTGVDSDDELLPNSLERFYYYWNIIIAKQEKNIAGVYYPCRDQHGNIIGTLFPKEFEVDDFVKILWKYKIKGDKGAFWKTEVLRLYPFPEYLKNVIVPEGSLLHLMSKEWKVCVINEALVKVWVNESGRDDHLSMQSTLKKNYPAQLYYYKTILNNSLRHFTIWPKLVCGIAFNYARLSFLTNKNL